MKCRYCGQPITTPIRDLYCSWDCVHDESDDRSIEDETELMFADYEWHHE